MRTRAWVGRGSAAALLAAAIAAPAGALPEGWSAERWVEGLGFPVTMAAAEDGRVLVVEKGGAVRLVVDGALVEDPVATFDPRTEGEAGLTGVALEPDFATSGRFLVTYAPAAHPDALHVARLALEGRTAEVLADPWRTFPSRAGADRHFGARVQFGPEGHLWVGLGELDQPRRARDPADPPGTLQRLAPDGTDPGDGPIPGTAAWAYGLRNPFGFDVASDGTVWIADNGPELHDEVHRAEAGQDLGWPLAAGFCDHVPLLEHCVAGLTDPVVEFHERVGPTGVEVYEGALLEGLQGDVLVGGWHSARIHRLRPTPDGAEALEPLFTSPAVAGEHGHDEEIEGHAGVVDLEVAPDGALLVLIAGEGEGEILRIAPDDALLDPGAVVAEGVAPDTVPPAAEACASAGGATAPVALLLLALALRSRGSAGRAGRRRARGLLLAPLLLLAAGCVHPEFAAKGFVGPAQVRGNNADLGGTRTGFGGGLSARTELLPFAHLEADLQFLVKGADLAAGDAPLSLAYFQLPVRVALGPELGAFRPEVFGGLVPGFNVGAWVDEDDLFDRVERFELAFTTGAAVRWEVEPHVLLLTELRWQRGLTNVYDDFGPLADQALYTDAFLVVLGAARRF